MILAHLSDLHLRDGGDAIELARQLDRIAARRADHLVITGDLLDRWNPPLLDRVLELLASRGLLDPERLTIIHGNHDLASSGGHPRRRRDLLRLATRFWDPPPLVAMRRRRFYARIGGRAPGVALPPPFLKPLASGIRLAALDTVPAPWTPLVVRRGEITLQHGSGAIEEAETRWLSAQRGPGPLVVLVHHFPLEIAPFRWRRSARASAASWPGRWLQRWSVTVPMEIRPGDRDRFWSAAHAAGAVAVLCGHVHRARLEHHGGIAVGLNGQSGAEWAGRTIAYYRIDATSVSVEYQSGETG